MDDVQQLIDRFNLQEHPEGGYFKETYRSKEEIPEAVLGDHFEGSRNYSTGIYFLLTSGVFSAFHRIQQDEMWHFYKGSPITIHVIHPNGKYSRHVLGLNFEHEEVPQFTVPKKCWFAAEVKESDSYAFVGCTVSPGFDFKDFELAQKDKLTQEFPGQAKIIDKFTRS